MKTPSNVDHALNGNTRRCPLCHGTMNRIPRRFVDLVLSMFIPVRRYRCRSFDCDWEGNLRTK